jgi:hypothetical protein
VTWSLKRQGITAPSAVSSDSDGSVARHSSLARFVLRYHANGVCRNGTQFLVDGFVFMSSATLLEWNDEVLFKKVMLVLISRKKHKMQNVCQHNMWPP